MPKHEFTRVRQDTVRRTLYVEARQQITPRMLRIVFRSQELEGFHSPSPDDHIKIFLPAQADEPAVMRDFTPRAWNADAGTLTLDFALHPHGPAADWARQAEIGDRLEIGGPRGSTIAPADFDWYLLLGDATALPSIGRRMEQLPPDAAVQVIALVEGAEEEPYLGLAANRQLRYVHTTGDADRDLDGMRAALQQSRQPAGEGLVWIAAEVSIARGLYRYVLDTMAQPKEWVKAAGYWSAGKADAGERIA